MSRLLLLEIHPEKYYQALISRFRKRNLYYQRQRISKQEAMLLIMSASLLYLISSHFPRRK